MHQFQSYILSAHPAVPPSWQAAADIQVWDVSVLASEVLNSPPHLMLQTVLQLQQTVMHASLRWPQQTHIFKSQ